MAFFVSLEVNSFRLLNTSDLPVTKLNLRRLRYLIPVVLAALCLVAGVSLIGDVEQSREAAERTARALIKVHSAAELVSELRYGSAEHLAGSAASVLEEWRTLSGELDALGRDKTYGGSLFREQIARTSELIGVVRKSASLPAARAQVLAKDLGPDASMTWAGWQRVETGLTRRLLVDVAGPADHSASIAMLSALGCLACALLLWQTWHTAQLREGATLLDGRMRESEIRSRAMAESAREILIQAEPSGRILRSNHKLSATEMASLFDTRGTWDDVVAGLASESAQPRRQVWLSGEREGRLAELRVFPVRDAAGGLIRVDAALLDITDWHAAEREGQARVAGLEEKQEKFERQLRELLDQSFELAESRGAMQQAADARMESLLHWGRRAGQPLEDIAGLTARLNADPVVVFRPEEASALAGAVNSVAASLRALADFAGLERGSLELTASSFSPRSLLEAVVESLADRAEAKHLEMPCFVHQDVPEAVLADAGRLREVLGHAIEHAIEHTGCGEVSVRLALASRAGANVNLRFEVEDSGNGFTRDALAAVFEPFHPGQETHQVLSGLAFAKRLVERMGGQTGAESESGQGTRVWFLLPAEAVEPSAPGPALPPELLARRIMIVDDAASQRGALVELSRTLGLEAAACGAGETALAQLRSAAAEGSPYHYVLADFDMPGLSGANLAAAVAEDPALAGVEVFLLTAHSLRIEGGLSKPVRLGALAELIQYGSSSEERPVRREAVMAAGAGSPIVLIVEDNLVNQRVAVRLVEKMGYRAAVVSNGMEAIQAFQRQHYDLILMDCQMPELDGFTATAEIRRLETPGSRIPIVAMTANAMRGDREKCIACGMDDYISKPVGYEDLRVLITRWLARNEMARL